MVTRVGGGETSRDVAPTFENLEGPGDDFHRAGSSACGIGANLDVFASRGRSSPSSTLSIPDTIVPRADITVLHESPNAEESSLPRTVALASVMPITAANTGVQDLE